MKYNCTQNAEVCTHQEGEIPINSLTNLRELFDYVEIHLKEFNTSNDLIINILPQIHTKLVADIKNSTSESNLLVSLNQLLQKCEEHVADSSDNAAYEFVLQIIYQVLITLQMLMQEKEMNSIRLTMHSQIMAKLIENMFKKQRNDNKKHNLILAKELACLQLYLELYAKEQTFIIKLLWSKLNENCHTKYYWPVLVALFDYFVNNIEDMLLNEQFYENLQELLMTDQNEARKAAFYLMKKLLTNWQKTKFYKSSIVNENNWLIYITIMENLMGNQSHLTMPALAKLEDLATFNEMEHQAWTSWLNILYKVLLMQNNVLVKRRSIEFLLKNTDWQKLDKQLQELLLNALNSTNLYNKEGYFLSTADFQKFFSVYNRELYEIVDKINWKSVPLHYFVENTAKCLEPASEDVQVFMQLTKCVRKLQNVDIREDCMKNVFEKFNYFKNFNLNLKVFCQLIVEAHGIFTDDFLHYHIDNIIEMCGVEKQSLEFVLKDFNYFSCNFYDTVNARHNYGLRLLRLLKAIPNKHHGYMCFYVIFGQLNAHLIESVEAQTIIKELCPCLKDLTKATNSWTNIKDVQKIFQSFAQFELTEADIVYINKLAIDYFILSRIHNLLDLLHTNLSFDVFLELINENTMHRLLEIIKDCCSKKQTHSNNEFIKKMLSKLQIKNNKHFKLMESILLDEPQLDNNLLEHLNALYLKFCYESRNFIAKGMNMNVKNLIDIFISFDAYTLGDARIEYIYLKKFNRFLIFEEHIREMDYDKYFEIQNALLEFNHILYTKKSRYFPNSPEHIMQTRIARLLLYLRIERGFCRWSDNMWLPVLKQNNQSNVTIMYEHLIATTITRIDKITEKLVNIHKYTASQQVSLMSVAYIWQTLNHGQGKLKVVIDMLLPLTMGAGFSTRLYAQLFIYKLLESPLSCDSSDIKYFSNVRKAIVLALGQPRLTELSHDVRIMLPHYYQTHPIFLRDIINCITNGPFGEISYFYEPPGVDLKLSKDLFARKLKNAAKLANENCNEFNDDIPVVNELTELTLDDSVTLLQRKVEPSQNLLMPHNLLAFSGIQKNNAAPDVYIVASLIDKLPNLGGIARTCEVLGLQNLIINKISDKEKPDFKNLSLTAEQYLNIIEIKTENLHKFLAEKQLEGYKVIGAEQVSHSKNFVNFTFPKKAIILLGHEKEGIPANLLSCLDFAVEIPQFGNVRSLNVHVTGALFMWEYCKQHIIK